MDNFLFNAYTKVWFGKGQVNKLADSIKEFGNKVLLVYGGGSIKKNGIYDDVKSQLKCFEVFELSGVEPNPKIESVREGVKICKENNINMVLAVGGGSVIDCSKLIAAGYYYDGDPWDMVLDAGKITEVLPVIAVLTMAATGSEMNKNSVISNMSTNEKYGTASMKMIPKVAILDPEYTFTVSAYQTAAGVADIMSHVFESYFKKTEDAYLQDKISEGILQTCIKYAKTAIEEPNNYEARANIMWASTNALNGLCGCGKGGSWSCHAIEHELSAFYDITHGVGLAIVTPSWMRYVLCEETVDKFVEFATNVWKIESNEDKFVIANMAIDKTQSFFKELGIPTKLSELGIDETHFEKMAYKAATHGNLKNAYKALDVEDVVNIYKMSL
ncbi:MAG: iron-containing alcohol dehydrogenase [Lachnospira sp.]|nr:iron-containing alcohol dehydrogenase [Lachnospira sp.]